MISDLFYHYLIWIISEFNPISESGAVTSSYILRKLVATLLHMWPRIPNLRLCFVHFLLCVYTIKCLVNLLDKSGMNQTTKHNPSWNRAVMFIYWVVIIHSLEHGPYFIAFSICISKHKQIVCIGLSDYVPFNLFYEKPRSDNKHKWITDTRHEFFKYVTSLSIQLVRKCRLTVLKNSFDSSAGCNSNHRFSHNQLFL